MSGIDNAIAGLGGGTLPLVLAVALLLGLRHATDPDHLAAVSTLIASRPEEGARGARRLGLAWGLGHATTLFCFGLPIALWRAYLPEPVRRSAEFAIGLVIALLALRLLLSRRRSRCVPVTGPARSPRQAFGIGLLHGVGGSAGIGVLLIAGIPDRAEAAGALLLFAAATAASMATLSSGFGYVLTREHALRRVVALAPALAVAALAFGAWYALAAV